jgi:predicted lipoprotein with Yx(FWY)xxD motif
MRMIRRLLAPLLTAAAILALSLAGSGPIAAAAAPQGENSGVIVTSGGSAFGRVLFTDKGRALYVFSFDTVGTPTAPAKSACAEACAVAWIPLLAPQSNGPFDTDGGVQKSHLGTIERTKPAGFQVTYFGQPLYEFVADKAPGQTNGENVAAFNGIWHLIKTDGRPDAGQAMVSLELSPNGPVLDTPTAFSTFRSLYMLTTDPPDSTTCLAACATFWPPLLTTERPKAGPGVLSAGLGTIRRPDGTRQVTYFDHPLYLFAFDLSAGAPSGLTNGEDLVDSLALGVWYTMSASGAPNPGTATVTGEASSLGTILAYTSPHSTIPGPFTLYAFSADTPAASACTDGCARVWPPVITSTAPLAASGSGVDQSHLGAILRSDGTFQVTYFGHPLYLFSHAFTGTSGEGINAFGGTFKVVSLSGATP